MIKYILYEMADELILGAYRNGKYKDELPEWYIDFCERHPTSYGSKSRKQAVIDYLQSGGVIPYKHADELLEIAKYKLEAIENDTDRELPF